MTDKTVSENQQNKSLGFMRSSFYLWEFLRECTEIIMNHPVYKHFCYP